MGERPRARRRILVSSAVLLGLALTPYPQTPAGASCAAPSLEVRGSDAVPVEIRRGEAVTVTGRGFVEGCDDTGEVSAFSCSGEDAGESETPMVDVELVLLSGQPTMKQVSLAVSDAGSAADNRMGWVTWSFTVPTDQPLGRAVVKTVGSEPLRVRVLPAG